MLKDVRVRGCRITAVAAFAVVSLNAVHKDLCS
jgi:hypothetical protein